MFEVLHQKLGFATTVQLAHQRLDSKRIAVALSDGTLRVWPVTDEGIRLAADRLYRDLTPAERKRYLPR